MTGWKNWVIIICVLFDLCCPSYSLSCSFYSFCLDKLVKRFRAKPVYIGGQLVYCLGMVAMAITRWWLYFVRRSISSFLYFVFINISHFFAIISTIPRSKWGVLVFSWSAGIMWANLFFVFLLESWNFYCRDDISYLAFLCTFSSPTSPSSACKPGTPPCSRCPTCWSPTTTRPTPSSAKTPGSSGRSELSFATYRSSDWNHDPQIMRIE